MSWIGTPVYQSTQNFGDFFAIGFLVELFAFAASIAGVIMMKKAIQMGDKFEAASKGRFRFSDFKYLPKKLPVLMVFTSLVPSVMQSN